MMYLAISVPLPEENERIPLHAEESKYKERSHLGSTCDPCSPAGEVGGQGGGGWAGMLGGGWAVVVSGKIYKMVLSRLFRGALQ